MKCPKCGQEMQRTGLAELAGEDILTTLECPACHYRMQQKQGRPPPPRP